METIHKKLMINKTDTTSFFIKLILLASLGAILSSCTSTKSIPKDKLLLKKSSISMPKTEGIDMDIMQAYLKQKPNKKILGLYPFHLNVYQLLTHGKERKWKKKVQGVIGEEPVLYDPELDKKTLSNLTWYLENKGFYRSELYEKKEIKGKTIKIIYEITPNLRYQIKNLSFTIQDSLINAYLRYKIIDNSLLKDLAPFDIDLLEAERTRINQLMRNHGYYAFSRDFIEFIADTLESAAEVKLQINIKKPDKEKSHIQYFIKGLTVYLNVGVNDLPTSDTITRQASKLIFTGDEPFLSPDLIFKTISIRPGQLYQVGNLEDTYRRLNDLQQFKTVNVQFTPAGIDSLTGQAELDCQVVLSTNNTQAYQVAAEGTNSSTYWGIGGNLTYSHKNLYKGAEILNLKLRGAFEYMIDEEGYSFNPLAPNILDYGIEGTIHFPEFWLPYSKGTALEKYNPKTKLSAQFGHQKKPYYTRRLLNAGFGYTWKTKPSNSHQLNPIELNIISLTDTTAEFNEIFDTLYMKYSYQSQFISASNYAYQFSSQDKNKQKDFYYVLFRAETAGNLLAGFNMLIGRQITNDGYYELFSTRFAQYMKSDIDLRYYHYFGNSSLLVYRGFVGVGYPYGNNHVLPFVKKYFTGGPNSIRAWPVRSLGPGTYVDNSFFPDLSADIKLEGNIEYRFDVLWRLKGAVFLDMGNIWAINTYDEREGSLFKFSSFYRQIAVGTGLGARFDFDFLLFRIDLGLKLVDPELPEGQRWLYTHRSIQSSDLNWNFGIDYPF